MNNWKELLENRLKTCDNLIDKHIEFDAGTEHEYFEEVEKFLNLESAFLQALLKDLENFKPNELKGVSNNEQNELVCSQIAGNCPDYKENHNNCDGCQYYIKQT